MNAGKPDRGGIKIAPSILSADFGRLAEEVARVEEAGADSIHVDVMDGRFVPNITIGPLVVERVKAAASVPLDVHLMIVEPDRYLEAFVEAGADVVYVHQEACLHLHRTIWRIRDLGRRAAAALNPATPAGTLQEILPDLDRILVMTVNPGFGGQRFINGMTAKIERTRKMIDESSPGTELEVDGGITPETAPLVVEAGADHLVAGNSIFKAGNVAKAVEKLRKAARGG